MCLFDVQHDWSDSNCKVFETRNANRCPMHTIFWIVLIRFVIRVCIYFISPNEFLFYLWTWTLTWFKFHSNIPKSTACVCVCTVLIETLCRVVCCYTVRQFYHKFMNFEHQMQTRKPFDIPYMKLNSTHHQQINAHTHTWCAHNNCAFNIYLPFVFASVSRAAYF